MQSGNQRIVSSDRIDITGYRCPFIKENPVVLELPNLSGYYVPVFKDRYLLENAMRHLDVRKYKMEMVGNTHKFYEIVHKGGAKIVVNPQAYNGVTIWDLILPMEEGIIVPGKS